MKCALKRMETLEKMCTKYKISSIIVEIESIKIMHGRIVP
jgi:hypothetical protein